MSFDIVTPSYPPDLNRCRNLCETIDRHSAFHNEHLIIVDKEDLALFQPLSAPRRRIVCSEEILPRWLFRSPIKIGALERRMWLSPRALPVHGWHMQQIKKIAICHYLSSESVLYADSEVMLVRPLLPRHISLDGKTRLFGQPDAITEAMPDHLKWTQSARELLGLPPQNLPATDYIGQLIPWHRQSALRMCHTLERVAGHDWITALLRKKTFSEYLIYGHHAQHVEGAEQHHLPTTRPLCHTYWDHASPDDAKLRSFIAALDDDQIGVAVNSVSHVDAERIREAIRGIA